MVRQAVGTVPIVAIGGITFKNSEIVLGAGADAVAVIRDIWTPAGQAAILTKRFLTRS
jgi:thiamine monophosphate synthase